MNQWLQVFLESDYGAAAGSPSSTLFMVLLAFVIGQFVGWVYMVTHTGLSYSRSFVASLVVLPIIIALMMIIMAGSIVIAFGLLAVFAVVRFRNVLKDTRDTSFILWAILEGLGIGTMRFSTTVIGALGVAVVLVYLRVTSFGSRHRYDAVLDLRVQAESLAVMNELRQVFRRHCVRTLLANRTMVGDGVQRSYRLMLRDPDRFTELRTALEHTAGVADVALFLHEDEAEI